MKKLYFHNWENLDIHFNEGLLIIPGKNTYNHRLLTIMHNYEYIHTKYMIDKKKLYVLKQYSKAAYLSTLWRNINLPNGCFL